MVNGKEFELKIEIPRTKCKERLLKTIKKHIIIVIPYSFKTYLDHLS